MYTNFKTYRLLDFIFLISCLVAIHILNITVFYFYIFVFYLILIFLRFILKSKNENLLFTLISYFFVFIVFIIRSNYFNKDKWLDFFLNTLEHFLFSILICLYLNYFILYFIKISTNIRLISIVFIFNIIGFINEFFQNFVQNKPLFSFDEHSFKDIVVNFIGSIIFFVLMLFLNKINNKKII